MPDNFTEKLARLKESVLCDENTYVIQRDDNGMLVEDLLREQRLYYRMIPHTQESLVKLIHDGPHVNLTEEQKTAIANRMLKLPPETLINLRHVILIKDYDDLVTIISECGLDDEMLPDNLLEDENELNDDAVGTTWLYESAVIINVTAIENAARNVTADRPGLYRNERDIGFWVTLIHELRHVQIECLPFEVPWFSESDGEEQAVEEWAISMFETQF